MRAFQPKANNTSEVLLQINKQLKKTLQKRYCNSKYKWGNKTLPKAGHVL